jgi:1,4-dihydroxy-2-naphthoate octaprenyltransferase
MPVFLFALSTSEKINWINALISFVVLHLFVYPASNGYNSFNDKDETSIGGLKHPPKVTRNLLYTANTLDCAAIIISLFVSLSFALMVLIYILISRAYSYRKLRLKKFAFLGFITVFVFQGAFTFYMTLAGVSEFEWNLLLSFKNILCAIVASFFIGSVYPLTQIYQHKADNEDGVKTISFVLGYKGTFVFSGLMFTLATTILFYYYNEVHQRFSAFLFLTILSPVVVKLFLWMEKVIKDSRNANFENTMTLNWLASTCMNLYFVLIILNKIYNFF